VGFLLPAGHAGAVEGQVTDDISEIARLMGNPEASGKVRVGSQLVPRVQIRSIEDVEARNPWPLHKLGVALLALGAVLLLKADSVPRDQHSSYGGGGAVALVAGSIWILAPGAKRYGWKVNLFHGPPITLWFNTPAEAGRYRAYLLTAVPGVPFVHHEPIVFWWISF
jgi:hypothetical protein